VALLSALLLGVAMAAVVWRYGSWEAAAAVAAGRKLLISPTKVDFGIVNAGTVQSFEITLRNEGPKPVSVLGVDDCCYSKLEEAAPITIPAFGHRTFVLTYTAGGVPGQPFRVAIPLLTTSNDSRPIVEVTGTVSSKLIPEPDPRIGVH
jgi:hypothetical protein